ncbi:MAG: hypothetical protein ACE5I1_01920 [bacterium]
MTLTTKTFYDEKGKSAAELSVKSIFNRNASCIELELSGAILGENSDEFLDFVSGSVWRIMGCGFRPHFLHLSKCSPIFPPNCPSISVGTGSIFSIVTKKKVFSVSLSHVIATEDVSKR